MTRDWIVVGGDTTPSATAALRWAVAEAARTPGTGVLVVHAFDLAGRADLAVERDVDRCRRDARYRTQSWVIETLRSMDVDVPVMVQTPDAAVEEALATAAGRACLVVVGEPQNGRRRDLAAMLSRRCSCPVVTVCADQTTALAG